MDNRYDSEAIQRLIREGHNPNSNVTILPRNYDMRGCMYHREIAQQFNDLVYPRRQIVENKFSVLKRKISDDRKARRILIQTKEIAKNDCLEKLIGSNIFFMVTVFFRA